MENWLVKLLSGCRGMLILLDGVDKHEPSLSTDAEYVVFWQRRGQERSELELWAWRYVVSSMDEPTAVFDTIPESWPCIVATVSILFPMLLNLMKLRFCRLCGLSMDPFKTSGLKT